MSRQKPASQAGLFARKGTAKPSGLIDRTEELAWPQRSTASEAPAVEEPAADPDAGAPAGPEDELEPPASLLTIGVRWSRRSEEEAVCEVPATADSTPPGRDEEIREPPPQSPAEPAPDPASELSVAAHADEAAAGRPHDSVAELASWTTAEPHEAPAEAARSSPLADRRRPMATAWLGTAVVAVLVIACAVLFGLAWYLHSGRLSSGDGNAEAPASSIPESSGATSGNAASGATVPPAVERDIAGPQPPRTENPAPLAGGDGPAAPPDAREEATRFPPPAGIGDAIPTSATVEAAAATQAADASGPTVRSPSATARPRLPPKGPIYAVQLASVGAAQHIGREWQRLQQALPDVLRGLGLRIEEAEVDGVGRVYRLRTGAFAGYSEARTFCGKVEARGASCLVVRW